MREILQGFNYTLEDVAKEIRVVETNLARKTMKSESI